MSVSTQLSNGTNHAMKVSLGIGGHGSELAKVQAGGTYILGVDFCATYREYSVQVDAPGVERFIVSTDDLCDYKTITIKDDGCKLDVQKEPRKSSNSTTAATKASMVNPRKHSWLRSWTRK